MKRLMLVGFVALGFAFSAQADAVTATWQGASGAAWETASNWDIGAVPGPTTNVVFAKESQTVKISSVLPTFGSMQVKAKNNEFLLSADARMTTTGPVTNLLTTTYHGGTCSFGGELVVGRNKNWPGGASYSTKVNLKNCVSEIAGRIYVTGYSGNGLSVDGESTITCAGFLVDGTRNETLIKGKMISSGDIEIRECYPNEANPYPFTVDGGVVTNNGKLIVSGQSAHSIPFRIQNGSSWKQVGDTTIGGSSSQNRHDSSLQILSGSTFEGNVISIGNSNGPIGISQGKEYKLLNNGLLVDGSSTLTTADDLAVFGFKDWVTISDKSTFKMTSGTFRLATQIAADGARFVVSGGSTCELRNLSVGANKGSDNTTIAISNSTLSVVGGVNLPAGVNDGKVNLILSGSDTTPAKASFPGGLVIGAASNSGSTTREDPTTVVLDNGVLEIGKIDASMQAGTSGDGRLGNADLIEVKGISDATNRLVIAGKMSCFVPKHRMMTSGHPIIEFQVPEGGYQNADYDNCGFYVKNAYLTNAKIIIDVTRLARDPEWKEYVLARSTVNDLNVDLNKVEVVAPTDCDCKWEVCWKDKKSPLSIKVRFPPKGLMLIVR